MRDSGCGHDPAPKPYLDQRVRFDPITATIEDFVHANARELENQARKVQEETLRPLEYLSGRRPSARDQVRRLTQCFDAGEAEFGRIASQLSLDPWMSVLGRLPPRPDWTPGWDTYLKLGLARYAATDRAECVNDFETPWARIYCRTPDVRAGRLTAVASFSGVSR